MAFTERGRAAGNRRRAARAAILDDPPLGDGPMRQAGSGLGRLFWGLLVGLGLGMLILVTRLDTQKLVGWGPDDFGTLVIRVALLVFLGGAVLMLFRHRLSAALEAAMFWGLLGLLLAAGYTYRHELRAVADR